MTSQKAKQKNTATEGLKHLQQADDIAQAIVTWYKYSHRELPWRNTSDPYAIWLSEIMLQQTQVVTVLPYYQRFLNSFPTIKALAEADDDNVLKHWEGLGYYTRCRNLHKAAKLIMEKHNGCFPDTLEAVEALPGIGKSTAGAILTFAYKQRHPILDGNVKRVLARLLDWDQPVSKPVSQKTLWQASRALVDNCDDVYSLNQALMELGATLCSRTRPSCLLCPVKSSCLSLKNATQEARPVKEVKKPVPHKAIGVAIIWNDLGELLIQQRPAEGLLGGLWEFPGGKQEPEESIEKTVHREIQEELGLSLELGEALDPVSHAYSHFKVTLYAYHCRLSPAKQTPKPAMKQRWQWIKLDELDTLAFPTANRKLFSQLEGSPFLESKAVLS